MTHFFPWSGLPLPRSGWDWGPITHDQGCMRLFCGEMAGIRGLVTSIKLVCFFFLFFLSYPGLGSCAVSGFRGWCYRGLCLDQGTILGGLVHCWFPFMVVVRHGKILPAQKGKP